MTTIKFVADRKTKKGLMTDGDKTVFEIDLGNIVRKKDQWPTMLINGGQGSTVVIYDKTKSEVLATGEIKHEDQKTAEQIFNNEIEKYYINETLHNEVKEDLETGELITDKGIRIKVRDAGIVCITRNEIHQYVRIKINKSEYFIREKNIFMVEEIRFKVADMVTEKGEVKIDNDTLYINDIEVGKLPDKKINIGDIKSVAVQSDKKIYIVKGITEEQAWIKAERFELDHYISLMMAELSKLNQLTGVEFDITGDEISITIKKEKFDFTEYEKMPEITYEETANGIKISFDGKAREIPVYRSMRKLAIENFKAKVDIIRNYKTWAVEIKDNKIRFHPNGDWHDIDTTKSIDDVKCEITHKNYDGMVNWYRFRLAGFFKNKTEFFTRMLGNGDLFEKTRTALKTVLVPATTWKIKANKKFILVMDEKKAYIQRKDQIKMITMPKKGTEVVISDKKLAPIKITVKETEMKLFNDKLSNVINCDKEFTEYTKDVGKADMFISRDETEAICIYRTDSIDRIVCDEKTVAYLVDGEEKLDRHEFTLEETAYRFLKFLN